MSSLLQTLNLLQSGTCRSVFLIELQSQFFNLLKLPVNLGFETIILLLQLLLRLHCRQQLGKLHITTIQRLLLLHLLLRANSQDLVNHTVVGKVLLYPSGGLILLILRQPRLDIPEPLLLLKISFKCDHRLLLVLTLDVVEGVLELVGEYLLLFSLGLDVRLLVHVFVDSADLVLSAVS